MLLVSPTVLGMGHRRVGGQHHVEPRMCPCVPGGWVVVGAHVLQVLADMEATLGWHRRRAGVGLRHGIHARASRRCCWRGFDRLRCGPVALFGNAVSWGATGRRAVQRLRLAVLTEVFSATQLLACASVLHGQATVIAVLWQAPACCWHAALSTNTVLLDAIFWIELLGQAVKEIIIASVISWRNGQ